jgi:serine O-acetyltransferase
MKKPDINEIVKKMAEHRVSDCSIVLQAEATLPNVEKVKEAIRLIKALFFPDFFCNSEDINEVSVINLNKLYLLLNEQILRSLCFSGAADCQKQTAAALTTALIECLPDIKYMITTDVKAVCNFDPSVESASEVILCYPAIEAMLHYRTAHELLRLKIPLLPRMITELAHSATGIDIHPGAEIGNFFGIDHGTGVVIGETCIIGNHVRLYQGVTLGAKGFVYDSNGLPMNVPRHPIIEDNVTIYSNSTVLGRITIGHNSIIGGNVWQTFSVPPFSRIIQTKAVASAFIDGLGI